MKEYLNLEAEYEYSIDNFGRKTIDEKIVGGMYKGSNTNYYTVIKFKESNKLKSINEEKVILNIYVSTLRGVTVLPIEVINYSTMKSKVFLLSGTSVGRYSKLDITGIFSKDDEIEFKIKSIENKRGIISLNNKENEFPANLEIEYEKIVSLEIDENKVLKSIINDINETVKAKKTEGDREGVELYTIVKCLYNYFSEEICDLKEKVKFLEEEAIKNKTVEFIEQDEKVLVDSSDGKSDIGCFGFLAIKELKATDKVKVNSIVFSPEILEELSIDENYEYIIVEGEGIYSIRCNIEVTGMSLAIPNLTIEINEKETTHSKKGVSVPHQTLTMEIMQKLTSEDKIRILLKDVYKNTMVCGSIIVTKIK